MQKYKGLAANQLMQKLPVLLPKHTGLLLTSTVRLTLFYYVGQM